MVRDQQTLSELCGAVIHGEKVTFPLKKTSAPKLGKELHQRIKKCNSRASKEKHKKGWYYHPTPSSHEGRDITLTQNAYTATTNELEQSAEDNDTPGAIITGASSSADIQQTDGADIPRNDDENDEGPLGLVDSDIEDEPSIESDKAKANSNDEESSDEDEVKDKEAGQVRVLAFDLTKSLTRTADKKQDEEEEHTPRAESNSAPYADYQRPQRWMR